jgi:hypothetical protein
MTSAARAVFVASKATANNKKQRNFFTGDFLFFPAAEQFTGVE